MADDLPQQGDYEVKYALALALMVAAFTASAPTFAVDNTITPLCRAENAGNTYQRPGGFCDAVANNKTMLPWSSNGCADDDWECICASKDE